MTQIPWRSLAEEDWDTLRTYEDVLDEINGVERPDGLATLMQLAQADANRRGEG